MIKKNIMTYFVDQDLDNGVQYLDISGGIEFKVLICMEDIAWHSSSSITRIISDIRNILCITVGGFGEAD